MRATVGYQVIACDGQDVAALTGEPSRATLLLTLCGPGAGRHGGRVHCRGHRRHPSMRVALPWIAFFDQAIYCEADLPNSCRFNSGSDSYTSHFSTAVVAPGEIDDRFRNKGTGQGIGYPMFTLERLVNVAEILRIAGYDPYGYRGAHKQSIEMAIAYYACFAKGAGFSKIVTPDNSRLCPNASQYYGNLMNDVDRMVRSAPIAFPTIPRLPWSKPRQRESTSQTATTFSTDAILFGKWRD